MHPNYIVKTPKLLYIDRYGYIYPDCKTYKTPIIGHLEDPEIINKVIRCVFGTEEKPVFNMITVEVSSLCHAKCFYCFQEDGKRGECYRYYDSLMDFLDRLDTYWLFFSGGEILDQKDAMDFMIRYRQRHPDVWVHLKTNGNASADRVDFVSSCCSSAMVSFNGFTASSCRTLMDVDLEKTIRFCEEVKQRQTTNLCVKFLNSPVCISELPDFLEWAIQTRAKAIAIQTVYHYSFDAAGKSSRGEHAFSGLDSPYWQQVYGRVAVRIEKVLAKYADVLNQDTCNLASDKELFRLLPLSEQTRALFRTDGVYIIE